MFCFIGSAKTSILRRDRLVYCFKLAEQCVFSRDRSPFITRLFGDTMTKQRRKHEDPFISMLADLAELLVDVTESEIVEKGSRE